MKLNLSKLSTAIEESKFSKTEIASRCQIDRKTIENVLSGRDPKVSTITSLATILNLKISFLFDEEKEVKTEIRQAGRDYVEKGNIKHEGHEYYGVNYDNQVNHNEIAPTKGKPTYQELEEEVSRLQKLLLKTQAMLIDKMDQQ